MSDKLKIFNRAELIPEDPDDTPYYEALADKLYLTLRDALTRINEQSERIHTLELARFDLALALSELEARYEGHIREKHNANDET